MTAWALPAVPDGWPSFAGRIYWEEGIFSGYWIGVCSAWWRVGVCFPTRAAPSLLVLCSCADPASSQGTFSLFPLGPVRGFAAICRELLWSFWEGVVLAGLLCQPHEATVLFPGCGSPCTLWFLVGASISVGSAAVAHMHGIKGCLLLLLCLGPGVLEGQPVKKLVIEINEGEPPFYCPQRLFLVRLF